MINASFNCLSFKATPEELKSIKQACDNMAKKNNMGVTEESFDVAEIDGRFIISKHKTPSASRIEITLKNKNIQASTITYTKDRKFFEKNSTIKYFEQIFDSLKRHISKADEKECWDD